MQTGEQGPNLMRLISGYWTTQAVYVAAKLGIADLLAAGPRSSNDLAQATQTHAPSLYRLLRALAHLGLVVEEPGRAFKLAPLGQSLRADAPGSQKALAIMNGEEHYRAYGELLYSIQTGEKAFDKVFGAPCFDYLAGHPEQAALFDAAMTGVHGEETYDILAAYDFSLFGTLADVGGGNGTMLGAILARYPKMQGILFDLPHVVERARGNLASLHLETRCKTVAGNFFEGVPSGADAYLLRHILHDWNDEQCGAILRNIHRALRPGGKLLVAEFVLPEGNEASFGKLLDLTMLVIPGGKERTRKEYESLFAASGFRLTRVHATAREICLVEADRAE